MKPEDFRVISNRIGTLLGLIGDYNGSSEWSHGEVVQGSLSEYIVVEHNLFQSHNSPNANLWDTACIVLLSSPIKAMSIDGNIFTGNLLLLIHRYPDAAWDATDPNVHVFGISEYLGQGPLAVDFWRPRAVWLSSAAIMTVEEPLAPSEMAKVFQKRRQAKNSSNEVG